MNFIQIQLFGRNNTQVEQVICQSFENIINNQVEALKKRSFESEEVKDFFISKLELIAQSMHCCQNSTLDSSKYIVFPFKTIAPPENLQNQSFICSLIDTLAVLAFADDQFEIVKDYINIKCNGKKTYGVYYGDGQLSLKDAYIRILNDLHSKKVLLPPSFVCIPLSTSGDSALDKEKLDNIVVNICGSSQFIRPLSEGVPKCISLSSYIISEAQSIEAAKAHVLGVLSVG